MKSINRSDFLSWFLVFKDAITNQVKSVHRRSLTVNINNINPMVEILQQEQKETKEEMHKFSKHLVKSCIINVVIATLTYILMGAYIRAGVHFFVTILVFYAILRDSINTVNTKKIENIFYENQKYQTYPNLEEVYEATRQICELKGILRGRAILVNAINIFTFSFVVCQFIDLFIKVLM